jgi:DNA-binding CsgD family transcriptional regulator
VDSEALTEHLRSALDRGDLAAAARFAQALRASGDLSPSAVFLVARTDILQGRLGRASVQLSGLDASALGSASGHVAAMQLVATLDGIGLRRLEQSAVDMSESSDATAAALGLVLRSWAAFSGGDAPMASELADRAERCARAVSSEVVSLAQLVGVLATSAQGRVPQACKRVERLAADVHRSAAWLSPLVHAIAADLALATGRIAHAERHLDVATGQAPSTVDVWVFSLRSLISSMRGDRERATAQLDEARRAALRTSQLALHIYARAHAKLTPQPALVVDVWRLLDEIGVVEHRDVLAPVLARTVRRTATSSSEASLLSASPPRNADAAAWAAAILADDAATLQTLCRKAIAAGRLLDAAELSEDIAAIPAEQRTQRRRRAAARARREAIGLSSILEPSLSPLVVLSPAQARVVAELRLGRDNKTIANRLGVSVRTVESHLSEVYRKVGVTSRTALVSRLGSIADVP